MVHMIPDSMLDFDPQGREDQVSNAPKRSARGRVLGLSSLFGESDGARRCVRVPRSHFRRTRHRLRSRFIWMSLIGRVFPLRSER